MSGAVPGHGYRTSVTIAPACKCGWQGRPCGPGKWSEVEDAARAAFERHKEQVRHDTGYQPKTPRSRTDLPRRVLRLVKGW